MHIISDVTKTKMLVSQDFSNFEKKKILRKMTIFLGNIWIFGYLKGKKSVFCSNVPVKNKNVSNFDVYFFEDDVFFPDYTPLQI